MKATLRCNRRFRLSAFFALTALLPLCAQQRPASAPPASWKTIKYPALRDPKLPDVAEITLPNGIRLYLLENHELPLVRGTALVRTGNLFDPEDKVGLATITGETIRSGGTASKTGDQIDEQLENIAASVESQIGESYGSVSFSTLKERTDEVLAVFHDYLTGPAFREDKIELAKSQLRSGIARRNDDAQGISQREFANLLYGANNPYGWDMQYATLNNIRRDDVVGFYRRYFFPANVILAVQGDFSAPEMRAKLEKLFADWTVKQEPVPAFPKVQSKAEPGIYVATKTDVTQTMFAVGQLGGVLNDKDYPALEVMADILGGGFKSRLFQKVRTQLGYAYQVGASWGANYDHPGLFEISGSTKSASTADTLAAINAEVKRIRTDPVTEEELQSARETVLNSFVFNFDTPSKTLNRLVVYKYFDYPNDFIFQYQKAVKAVTREDILRVAKQYLDPSKFVIVAAGNPKDFGKPLSSLEMPVKTIDLTIAEPKTATAAVNPQSAAEGKSLLEKVRTAVGGTAKIAAVKDFTEAVTLQMDPQAGGIQLARSTQWLAPSHLRQEVSLPNGSITTYFDGATGWAATPQGAGPIPDQAVKQVQFESFRIWFPLLMSDRDPNRTVVLSGPGKLEISDKQGHSVLLTIDPATSLPASVTYAAPGGSGSVVETYSNWQDVNGIRLPRSTVITMSGRHYADATTSSASVNSGLTVEQISKKP